jgi:hypothetical protein
MEQLFRKKFVKRRFPTLKGVGGKSLEIDIYNEEMKLGLEHQGVQHFIRKKYFKTHCLKQVSEHDKRKREFCAHHGITLIEIRQVGEVTPDHELKNAIRIALEEKNFPLPADFERIQLDLDVASLPSLQENKWGEIKAEALKRGWTVISKRYLGSLAIHHFACDQGHRVEIKPSYLLQGQGCWQCEEKPVVFVDGKLFQSVTIAAEAIGSSVSAVSQAILNYGRVKGLRAASVSHKELNVLLEKERPDQLVAIAEIFDKLPVRRKVGEANGKPVLLGDGRMFSSAYEASRVVGVDGNVALAAAKRPKGKVNGIRIAQITKEQFEIFQKKPELIDEFWMERPLGPRKYMTRRRGVLTSFKEIFDGLSEASEALGIKQQQICDAVRRGTELEGRNFWFLSQEDVALWRNKHGNINEVF